MEAKEYLNKALKPLDDLRIKLVRKGENTLEELASEVDGMICKAHDELTRLDAKEKKKKISAEDYYNQKVKEIAGRDYKGFVLSRKNIIKVMASYASQSREIESITDKEIDEIRVSLQDSMYDYTMKTNAELIDVISDFGCGEIEFHTSDIERLLRENELLKKHTLSAKGKEEEECSECNCIGHNSENIKYHYSGCSQAPLKQ